jgi:hypothetical protein
MADEKVVVDILLEGEKDLLKASRQATKLTRVMNTLNKTLKGTADKDIILAQGAAKLAKDQKLSAKATDELTQALIREQAAMEKLRQVQASAGKKTSRFGVVTQQAGYQVQDFFVQVQGGTSAFVAFAQQGSQMAGIFGPWGAAIGAALAVLTPFARMLYEAGQNAEKLDKIYEELAGSSKDLQTATERLFEFDYVAYYGSAATAVRGLESAVLGLAAAELKSSLVTTKDTMSEGLDKRIAELQELYKYYSDRQALETPYYARTKDKISADLESALAKQDFVFNIKMGNKEELMSTASYLEGIVRGLERDIQVNINNPTSGLTAREKPRRERQDESLKERLAQTKSIQKVVRSLLDLQTSSHRVEDRNNKAIIGANEKLRELAIDRLRHENKFQEANEQELKLKTEIFKRSEEFRKAGTEVKVQEELLSKHRELVKGQQALNDAKRAGTQVTKDTNKGLREAEAAMKSLLQYSLGLDKALLQAQARLSDPSGISSRIAGRQHDLMQRIKRAEVSPDSELAQEAQRKIDQLATLERQIETRKRLEAAQSKLRSEAEQRDKALRALSFELEDDPFEKERMKLKEWQEEKLELVRGNLEAEMAIREHYSQQMLDIRERERQQSFSAVAGGINDILVAAANGDKKRLAQAKVVSAGMALINTFVGASKELAEKGSLGFATAAAVIAQGIGFVNAIKNVSASGASGGGSGGSAAPGSPTVSQQESTGPQRVMIEGLDKDALFSGEQLAKIFDNIYDENQNRGYIFTVGS